MALVAGACAEAREGLDAEEPWASALRLAVAHVQEREATLLDAEDQVAAAYTELMAALTTAAARIPAQQIREEFAARVDDVDRAILRGLVQGPRSSLEGRTGISKGVINSRLPKLHRIAGTTTQFQLGRAALALGWLDAPDD